MNKIFVMLAFLSGLAVEARAEAGAEFGWSFLYPRVENEPPSGSKLVKMLTMTNDRDTSLRTFNLMLSSSDAITGMYMDLSFGDTGNVFLSDEIESRNGVVIAEAMGKAAVILQGSFNRASLEGKFHLDYLNNAITGTYRRCEFFLRRLKGQGWYVQNAYTGQKIQNIHVTSWTFGVATIAGMCPAEQR